MYFLSTVAKHNFVISKTKRVIYFCVQTRSVVFDGKGGGFIKIILTRKKMEKANRLENPYPWEGGGGIT